MSESTRVVPVDPNFDLNRLVVELTGVYTAKGFTVTSVPLPTGVTMTFAKSDEGFKKYVGLGLGITLYINVPGDNTIILSYSDAEWSGKIVAVAVGWLVCLIPLITGVVGIVNQLELPKKITNDITNIVRTSYGGQQPYPPYDRQPYPPEPPKPPYGAPNPPGSPEPPNGAPNPPKEPEEPLKP